MPKSSTPNKIVWLASYPKSGNTWFRAFLSALMNDGNIDINNMHTGGLFSDRAIFNVVTDIDSTDLYDEEAKRMMANTYRNVAAERDFLSLVKVHDAYITDTTGQPIIPEDVTLCALYFIRNPLDIVGSLANHMHQSIEESVIMLNDRDAKLSWQKENLNRYMQFRQYLLDWSGHVLSWTQRPSFPVFVVRYEDMHADTFHTFKQALAYIGWQYTDKEIERAIAATSFDNLRKQEDNAGFAEKKMKKGSNFFRSGKTGNWENELTSEQISRIVEAHETVMKNYDYLK